MGERIQGLIRKHIYVIFLSVYDLEESLFALMSKRVDACGIVCAVNLAM